MEEIIMGNQSYKYETVMIPVESRKFRRQRLKNIQGNNNINSEWTRTNNKLTLKNLETKKAGILNKLMSIAISIRGKQRKRMLAKINRKINAQEI